MSWIDAGARQRRAGESMIEDIKNIKSGKKELREFGVTIGAVLIALGGIAIWRGKGAAIYFVSFGTVFVVLGLYFPAVLKPLQKVWMSAAAVIGFFMSRFILGIIFYLVITPISMIMKMTGKDILDERIDQTKISYWSQRSETDKTKESYEKQF